jgi:hypothetical protein
MPPVRPVNPQTRDALSDFMFSALLGNSGLPPRVRMGTDVQKGQM